MFLDLGIKLRVRSKEFLDRTILPSPGVVRVVSNSPREKAIIRQQLPAVTRREYDLIPLALLSTPVLERAVQRVIHQTVLDGVFGQYVGVQTTRVGRPFRWVQTNTLANYRSDAIGADNEVMLASYTIGEGYNASVSIDLCALVVIASAENKFPKVCSIIPLTA